jgi:type II secretion system protein G
MPGFSLTEVPQREVAGTKIEALRFKFDLAKLADLAGEKDKTHAADPELEKMMDKIFGKDGLLIQVASKDGTAVLVLGGDDDYLHASLARVSSKPAPPAFLTRALQQVGDLNPCVIVHYDLGRMMSGMKELMPMSAVTLPSMALATTFWGGVDGRVWRGVLELNLSEIAALTRMQEAPQPVSHEPKVEIRRIMQALDEYAINNGGKYPDSLEPLVTPDANGNAYLEGYDGEIPKDPWRNEYQYEAPSKAHPHPRVFSYGSDGAPGGTGDAADIDSDKLGTDK